jgi:hypothetical protein
MEKFLARLDRWLLAAAIRRCLTRLEIVLLAEFGKYRLAGLGNWHLSRRREWLPARLGRWHWARWK